MTPSDSDENNTLEGKYAYAEKNLHNKTVTAANEGKGVHHDAEYAASDYESLTATDAVIDVKQFDPVLARKMALVNAAIDEIGMSSFQWKLLLLNGFGYAVDSVCCRLRTQCLNG